MNMKLKLRGFILFFIYAAFNFNVNDIWAQDFPGMPREVE